MLNNYKPRNEVTSLIYDCVEIPLSIILVGIGDEDFSYMKSLDDNANLREK